jgi:EmrB/QacA subfamily drug resistance transporter
VDIADNRTRNRILLVLFVGVLMGALDIAIVGPALPAIQTYFHVNDRTIAWIFTIYVLFNLIGAPLMAKLSDVFGRQSLYVLDVTLFGLGSLLVALSPSYDLLLVGRAVQGLGAGGIFPVASAVIGDTFPPEKRGGALGLIGAVFGLAFIIGPILGGILLMFNWRWLFVVNLPIALLVIAMTLRLLPATRPSQRRAFDWAGMAALAVLLASLTYGLNRIDTTHFLVSLTSLEVWPFLLVTVVLLPILWRVERGAKDAVLHPGLFDSRQVVLVSALAVGAGLSESALVFVPALLVAAFSVTTSTASFMLVPVVLAMTVGSPSAGRMLDKYGSRAVVLMGTTLLTAGMAVVGFFLTLQDLFYTVALQIGLEPAEALRHDVGLALFYVAAVLVGLGLSSLLGAPLRYIMLNEAPLSERAAAQGATTLFMSVGQLLGGTLVGAVAASRGGGVVGYEGAYLLISTLGLLLILLTLGLKGRAEELATVRRNEMTGMTKSTQPAGS